MTFQDIISELSEALGAAIELDDDTCAVTLESKEGDNVFIAMQGDDSRGFVLTTSDLGEPPPNDRAGIYRALLEANDRFADTMGATLSAVPATGHIRLQRFDDMDALERAGVRTAFIAFANTAAQLKRIVEGYRDDDDDNDDFDERDDTAPDAPPMGALFV